MSLISGDGDFVDRSTPKCCNKTPPDTPNIPIESLYTNPDLNALLTYKLTLEREVVLAAEVSFNHMRSKQGNDNLLIGAFFWKPTETFIEPAKPKSDIGRLPSA